MISKIKLRIALAYFQMILLISILLSGMVFMHKHTTSSGQVIVHVHPYNLKTDPEGKKHKHTDREIHFLDVVFSGTFIETAPHEFEVPTWGIWVENHFIDQVKNPFNSTYLHFYLRGPPANV